MYKAFPRATSSAQILDEMRQCQHNIHAWGVQNRVTFEPTKEKICILHPAFGSGTPFRLFGATFDCKLTMDIAVEKLVRRARPKITTLLRTRRFYSTMEIFSQFKIHVLSLLEFSIGAIYHASTSVLEPVDRIQLSFLREVGVSNERAFLEYNLAPLNLRRDIAMLGSLHKIVLRQAHPDIQVIFPLAPTDQFHYHYHTRLAESRHNQQILVREGGTDLFCRSVFGLMQVYTLLPQDWVNSRSVHNFQSKITQCARMACLNGLESWDLLFSPRCFPLRLRWRAFV